MPVEDKKSLHTSLSQQDETMGQQAASNGVRNNGIQYMEDESPLKFDESIFVLKVRFQIIFLFLEKLIAVH